jgi:hypothetical protein
MMKATNREKNFIHPALQVAKGRPWIMFAEGIGPVSQNWNQTISQGLRSRLYAGDPNPSTC